MNAGFTYEGVGYFLYAQNASGLSPFYRCYLTNMGTHLYTTSASCEGTVGFQEGILGYIANSQVSGTTPLLQESLIHL